MGDVLEFTTPSGSRILLHGLGESNISQVRRALEMGATIDVGCLYAIVHNDEYTPKDPETPPAGDAQESEWNVQRPSSDVSFDPSVAPEPAVRTINETEARPFGALETPPSAVKIQMVRHDVVRRHDRRRHDHRHHEPTYDQLHGEYLGRSRSQRPRTPGEEPTTPSRRHKDATPLGFYDRNSSAQRYPREAMPRPDTAPELPPVFGADHYTPNERLARPILQAANPPSDLPLFQDPERGPLANVTEHTYGFYGSDPSGGQESPQISPSEGLFQRALARTRAETDATPPAVTPYPVPPRNAQSYEPARHRHDRNLVFERSVTTERDLPPLPSEPELPNGSRPFTTILPDRIDDPETLAHAQTAATQSYAPLTIRPPPRYDPLNPVPAASGTVQRYVSAGDHGPLHQRAAVEGPRIIAGAQEPGFSMHANELYSNIDNHHFLQHQHRVHAARTSQTQEPFTPLGDRDQDRDRRPSEENTSGRNRDRFRRFFQRSSRDANE